MLLCQISISCLGSSAWLNIKGKNNRPLGWLDGAKPLIEHPEIKNEK